MAKTAMSKEARGAIAGIGRRIAQRREALGLSATQLEGRMGGPSSLNLSLYRSQVGRWERGEVCPTALALIDLSRALGCTADWLLKGDEGLAGPMSQEIA